MTKNEMERIAAPHDSKAAKVRALHEAGAATRAISDFLGITYQHTYNVLQRASLIRKEPVDVSPVITLEVGRDGKVTLPADLLSDLGLAGGGQLFARQSDNGLLLMPREAAIAELQRAIGQQAPAQAALLAALLNQSTGCRTTPDG